MEWSEEAREITRELLRQLPSDVRGSMKESAATRAEALAAEENEDEVSMEAAVLAFIECTPEEWRDRLKDTLAYHGIDPEDYSQAFEN